ncbi:MAG: hypothetical protein KGY50_02665 [Candidatus Thermoplasmatota archaeon]|nr:hypothetical protein [Candidatus Thermoplasmatota archaeon]
MCKKDNLLISLVVIFALLFVMFSSVSLKSTNASFSFSIKQSFDTNYSFNGEQWDQVDYVIITRSSLIPSLSDFIDWQIDKGHTVEIKTISWIEETYDGQDIQMKVRMFLRDSYHSYNHTLQYVLLIGNNEDIPQREIAIDKGYGHPYSDFYYAELTDTDERSWDSDADGKYGELDDSYDLENEIMVGRIPFSDPLLVSRVLENTIEFEGNNNSFYKKHMLLMGAFLWNTTDTAQLMESIRSNPNLDTWTATTLYEKNDDYWSSNDCDYSLTKENVITAWNQNDAAFVNWAGHGTPISTHILGNDNASFISSFEISRFDTVKPSVIFANACNNANPFAENNLCYTFMKHNAVGFIGPSTLSQSKYEWQHENDGASQSFNFYFSDRFLSGSLNLGESFYFALKKMNDQGLWYDPFFETNTWGTLYGIPDLSITAVGTYPQLQFKELIDGYGLSVNIKNDGIVSAENITFDVTITGGKYVKILPFETSYDMVLPGEMILLDLPIIGFGFGFFSDQPILTVTVHADDITPISTSMKLNILGPFVSLI